MNIEIVKFYTVDLVKQNPDKIYVFGDNCYNVGNGGQAVIRGEVNSFGIVTKIAPDNKVDSFFTDKEFNRFKEYVDDDIFHLTKNYNLGNYQAIVFPKDGLGTGLADLPNKAPKCFEYLNTRLREEYGFDNVRGEILNEFKKKLK